ncbi:MAG: DUF2652 domain-containing protein [Gemmatimonadota bacterium]
MKPSLLFIPDISGFTKFVNETEVEHGRHIIAELLQLIVDQNQLGLTVSELEGDAVFFYREGHLPTSEELIAQSRAMFEAFHAHIRRYETQRICECGACCGALQLTLKIVAHAGPIDLLSVAGFKKPYGPDVIVAHRLLKNDVPDREYLLMTESSFSEDGDPVTPEWSALCSGSAEVDDVGVFPYRWIPLSPLHEFVPDPPPPPTFRRMENPFRMSTVVDRDPDELFELISNFDLRGHWNHGVDRLEYEAERVNRIGTQHRCVIGDRLIDFETVTNDFGEGRRAYGEHLPTNPIVREHVNYFIVEPEDGRSRLTVEVHYTPRIFPLSLLSPLMRRQAKKFVPPVLDALKKAAESDAWRPTALV